MNIEDTDSGIRTIQISTWCWRDVIRSALPGRRLLLWTLDWLRRILGRTDEISTQDEDDRTNAQHKTNGKTAHMSIIKDNDGSRKLLCLLTKSCIQSINTARDVSPIGLYEYLKTFSENNFRLKSNLEDFLKSNIFNMYFMGGHIDYRPTTRIKSIVVVSTSTGRKECIIIFELSDDVINIKLEFYKTYDSNDKSNNKKKLNKRKVFEKYARDALRPYLNLEGCFIKVENLKVFVTVDDGTYTIDIVEGRKANGKFDLELNLCSFRIPSQKILELYPHLGCTDLEKFILDMLEIFGNKMKFIKNLAKQFDCTSIIVKPVNRLERITGVDLSIECEFKIILKKQEDFKTAIVIISPKHFGDKIGLTLKETYFDNVKDENKTASNLICNIRIIPTTEMSISDGGTIHVIDNSKMTINYIVASGLIGDSSETYWRYSDNIIVLKPAEKFYVYPYGKVKNTNKIEKLTDTEQKSYTIHYKDFIDGTTCIEGLESIIKAKSLCELFPNMQNFFNGVYIKKGNMDMAIYTIAICVSESIRHFTTVVITDLLIYHVQNKTYSPEHAMEIHPMARKGSWPNRNRTGFNNKIIAKVRNNEITIFKDFINAHSSIFDLNKTLPCMKMQHVE